MSTEIVPSSEGESRELLLDALMGACVQRTAWRAVLDAPEQFDVDTIVAELRSMEPIPAENPEALRIFRLQQKLRLALRRAKGLILEGPEKCATCGVNLWDPVDCQCLACAEEAAQVPDYGSRGSCCFLRPTFDVRSGSWGLLYYSARGDFDNPAILMVAAGFASREVAVNALMPFAAIQEHLMIVSRGARCNFENTYVLIDLDRILELGLPLTPDNWRTYLRDMLGRMLDEQITSHSYAIRGAISDYEREIGD